MDLTSGATRRLTRHPADDGGPPAWSGDGETLFFRSKRDGEHYNIYRLSLKSERIQRLTDAPGGEGYVDVSPDGRSIVFHSERDQGEQDRNLEVYTLDLTSGQARRITRQPARRNGGAQWFPEGDRLINIARSPTASAVQVIDLSGTILHEYAATDQEDTFIGVLAPDASRFVFYSNRQGSIHLYALDLRNKSLTRISSGRAMFSTPSFSPDGRYLAVQYDDGTPSDVVIMDLQAPVDLNYAQGSDLLATARTRFEFDEAAKLLEQAVANNPEFGPGRLSLAAAYSKLSKRAEARRELAALRPLTAQLDLSERLLMAALVAKLNGDPQGEIAAWRAVIDADPGDRWAAYELAAAHMTVDEYEPAVAATERALALTADNGLWEASWIHYLRAKALFRLGRYEEAIVAAERGRDNETTWRSTLYRLGLAQFAAGDADGGAATVERYMEWSRQEGRISESFLNINVALFFYEIADFEQAEQYARIGVEQAPDSTYAHWALGYVLLEKGHIEKAMAVLRQGLELDGENADLIEAYGWGLYRQGDLTGALELINRAIARYPTYNRRALQHRAAVLAALANPEAPRAPPTPWLS